MKLPDRDGKITIEFSKQERTYLLKAEAIARRAARYSIDDAEVAEAADQGASGLNELLRLTAKPEA